MLQCLIAGAFAADKDIRNYGNADNGKGNKGAENNDKIDNGKVHEKDHAKSDNGIGSDWKIDNEKGSWKRKSREGR